MSQQEPVAEVATERAVFKVEIEASLDEVWEELTKTEEVQQAMFNSRLHTPGLEVGAPIRMRSPSGKYTAVVGEVLELRRPLRYAHTFRFTTYDDPPCSVIYDLRQVGEKVELTLTVEDIPVGTKTAAQMERGGTFIVNNLKAILEKGKPTLGARILFALFKLLEPFNPKRARSVNWP